MSVSFYQTSGHYDWMHPENRQWQIILNAGDFKISEVFDEEQDISDMLPTDVAELILERSEHYLYKSNKVQVQERVQWIRDHANEVNDEYLERQIGFLRTRIHDLELQFSEDYNGG